MAAPKGNVTVVTEVGYCPFCQRTRNLRREERHLGQLVRTTLDCESCHRTLSSTIGPPHAKPEPEPEPVKAAESEAAPAGKPAARKAAVKKPAARKPASAAAKKTAPAKKASTTKKSTTKKK
jgi:uncharacterized membrane protein